MRKSILTSNFKKYRKRKGLSQREVAYRCNISTGTYALIVRGHTDSRISTIVKIARVLDFPLTNIELKQKPARVIPKYKYVKLDRKNKSFSSSLSYKIPYDNNVRRIRKNSKMTIRNLAIESYISSNALSNIEKKRSIPSIIVAMLIAKALGSSVDQVFNIPQTSYKYKRKTLLWRELDAN